MGLFFILMRKAFAFLVKNMLFCNMIMPNDGKNLAEAEKFLATQMQIEYMYVFDAKGNQLLKLEGDYQTVSIPNIYTQHLKNATVTHNHPQGSSFSMQDVQMAVKYDLAELRVVTNVCVYSLQRKLSGWDLNFEDENTLSWLEECKTLAYDRLGKEIRQNITTLYEANKFFDSFVWSIFFFNFGYLYKKIDF